ncbi:MAG: hypothetical protein RL490_2462, partial [Pseudomonadota bacterium]
TRLRPWGAKGLLALSIASFARYQHDDAESWEHMALTRARPIGGSLGARAEVAAVVAAVLDQPRESETLRRAVLAMRADIAAAKPAKGVLDVKLAPGGLVDLEFVVHYQQLAQRSGFAADLGAAIAALTAAGQLPPGLGDAHDTLSRFLMLLRLVAPGAVPDGFSPAVEAVLARAVGATDYPACLVALGLAKQAIRQAFTALLANRRANS